MLTFLYTIQIFAIGYAVIFLITGSVFLFMGLSITVATIFGAVTKTDATGLGIIVGPPLLYMGVLILAGLYGVKRLLQFSAQAILPMIWIFIIASLVLWSGRTVLFSGLENVPSEMLNVILVMNAICIAFLWGYQNYALIHYQDQEVFHLTAQQKKIGRLSALAIVIALLGWILVHYYFKQILGPHA